MRLEQHQTPARADLQEFIMAEGGQVGFSAFMDRALYGPYGAYASGAVTIGPLRSPYHDFSTSPELSEELFGAVAGNAIIQAWQEIGDPFELCEYGAGNGTWARGILSYLDERAPRLYDRLTYTIVDCSPAMVARQRETLQGHSVSWIEGSAVDRPGEPMRGVILSNEFFDATGADRLIVHNGALQEIFTALDDNGNFIDVLGQPSPNNLVLPEARWVREGIEKPASQADMRMMQGIGNVLQAGYVITIDYGGLDGSIAQSESNFRTLGLATRVIPKGHKTDIANAYILPGLVDVTHNVNFSSLQQHGERAGLRTVYYRKQEKFMGLFGFWEEYRRLQLGMSLDEQSHALRVSTAHLPSSQGNFPVLIQTKL